MALWVVYTIGTPTKIISRLEAKNEKDALDKLVARGRIKRYSKSNFRELGNQSKSLRVDKISGQKGLFQFR